MRPCPAPCDGSYALIRMRGDSSHQEADALWRAMLLNPSPYRTVRKIFSRIPSAPRCKFCAVPFADVRGSTALAEQMRPKEFTSLMGRFYDTAAAVLVNHEAFVDKFVGDEIIGIFVPAMATGQHAQHAI